MAKETTNTGKLGRLQQFSAAMEANKDDLPHLEVNRVQLVTHLTQAQESAKQQAAFRASKQEASRQFRTSLIESERVANVLRLAVIQHFGVRSEKLAEFGLQPFRGRKAKPAAEEPQTTPSEPTASPGAETAATAPTPTPR
jgi:hypothetical protein